MPNKDVTAKTRPNKISFECDDLDFAAIQRAMSKRMQWMCLPDNASDVAGVVLAEICRGWMEFHGIDPQPKGKD